MHDDPHAVNSVVETPGASAIEGRVRWDPFPEDAAQLDALRRQLLPLAGNPNDFAHRARLYTSLYRTSGGNHAFALLAAHGALWAQGYLRASLRAGAALILATSTSAAGRAEAWRKLTGFADAFRALHQQVFVETELLYLLSDEPDLAGLAERTLPMPLLAALRRCHAARRDGRLLPEAERRELFDLMFAWEQRNVVGEQVRRAFAAVDWPLITAVARKPIVRFSYFPAGALLRFTDFTDAEERVRQGAQAFEWAERAGWDRVEQSADTAARALGAQPRSAQDCRWIGWLDPVPRHA